MECYLTCTSVCIFIIFSLLIFIFADDKEILPTVSTKNVTAHYCPYPCTVGNQTLCYPPPCPPPTCVDPTKYQPTDCCEYCPNGPNCRGPEGGIIPWNHWKIVDGKNCTCLYFAESPVCV